MPISTPSNQNCDPATTDVCRSKILLKWRSEMAEIATCGAGSAGEVLQWIRLRLRHPLRHAELLGAATGGALAFEMFRLDKGATEVYVQIATSRKFAIRCGATTHQQCLALPCSWTATASW